MKIDFAARPNVRFWEYLNGGWVKITLRPDQELRWEFGHRTEEGYHWEGHRWEYDTFDCVIRSGVTTEARDCDGRLDRYWSGEADCYVLWRDEWSDDQGVYRRLHYEAVKRSQRDHTAEAMGY